MAFVLPFEWTSRLIVGMFLELMTVWKTEDTGVVTAEVSTVAGNGGLQAFFDRKPSSHPIPLETDDDVIGTWNLRRTGVLFSKQKDSGGNEKWIFLIFIEPEDGKSLVFGHRVVGETNEQPNSFHENGKLVYCFEREDNIKNLMLYISANLEKEGPNYLTHIAEDILWGWGEFLKKMRLEILSVNPNYMR
jgi:hypothetical protein